MSGCRVYDVRFLFSLFSELNLTQQWKYLNASLGSTVTFSASFCLHPRPLRTCAEQRPISSRHGEAPPVQLYVTGTALVAKGEFLVTLITGFCHGVVSNSPNAPPFNAISRSHSILFLASPYPALD